MASYQDLFDAIARVRAATGDPDSWRNGLSGGDIATICNPLSSPGALGTVLAKVIAAHPDAFSTGSVSAPPTRTNEGVAADAIRDAETALAQQHSAAAQLDLQVVTAVLNAHAAHDQGLAELDRLQREIEDAVLSRTDLDTPAGAREFQRYLIGKLRDIRSVVDTAGLDATSKAALAAALASLYASETPVTNASVPDQPARVADAEAPPLARRAEPAAAWQQSPGEGPGLVGDSIAPALPPAFPDDPLAHGCSGPDGYSGPEPGTVPQWLLNSPAPQQVPTAPPAMAAAPPPPAPAWGGGVPASLSGPAPSPGLPSSLLSDLSPPLPAERRTHDSPVETRQRREDPEPPAAEPVGAKDSPEDKPDALTVELPDGQSVEAPSPELAAVITAAVAGTPIADAFRQQGITLPPPGSPVATPLDPVSLAPGDVGIFADRYALALGNGKALLDRQIQPIASADGPGFLGWSHPPGPGTVDSPTPEVPAPQRSAETAPS